MPRIKRVLSRALPNGDFIEATVELRLAVDGGRFDETGISPGFSATCSVWESRSNVSGSSRHRRGRESDSGGADDKAILSAFPHLKPIVDLHSSDPDGKPMHGASNGWYWYAGSRPDITSAQFTGYTGTIYPHQLEEHGLPDTDQGRRDYCYQLACSTLRVDEIPLADIVPEHRGIQVTPAGKVPLLEASDSFAGRLHAAFIEFADAQVERWEREADEARALLESLPEEVKV